MTNDVLNSAYSAGTDPAGVHVANVTDWMLAHGVAVVPPLRFDLIAGGRSNMTYRLTDARGQAWVLRRPPLGHLLATAHDMSREARIIAALASTPVPVAPVVGLCADETVIGAPFFVMEFVDGRVVRTGREAEVLAPPTRLAASRSIVDVLVRIHAVDPDAAGLGDLGRKEAYIARQLKRWYNQFEASACTEVRLVHDLYASLSENIPAQGPAAIVHGDYRLDNCLIDPSGTAVAVLDWELCTLGDPLADVGLLQTYWSEPGDRFTALADSPTQAEGFASRQQLLEWYAEASGRDLSRIGYYTAFGYWKVACIMAGVYTRWAAGMMGDPGEVDVGAYKVQVLSMAQMSALALAG